MKNYVFKSLLKENRTLAPEVRHLSFHLARHLDDTKISQFPDFSRFPSFIVGPLWGSSRNKRDALGAKRKDGETAFF